MHRNLVADEIDRLKAALHAANARREELWKRAERAESELAAAQAELTAARRGPVVEWRTRIDVEEATPGDFGLVVGEGGWTLEFFDKHGDAMQVDGGPQTGLEGKAAALAAYRKAAGL